MADNGDLTVTDTRVADEGVYTCVANGIDGMASVTAIVNVVGDLISCSGETRRETGMDGWLNGQLSDCWFVCEYN